MTDNLSFSGVSDFDSTMSDPSAAGSNGDNSTTWIANLFNQLVLNDTNLHQAIAQAFAQTNQATAEIATTAQAAYAAAQAAQATAQANIGTAEGGNNADQAETTPSVTRSVKPNIAEPEPFDGQYENFEPFLYQLLANFRAKPQAYTDYHVKIDMALSWMQKGVAKEWATTMFRLLEQRPDHFADWDAFVTAMKSVFEDPNKKTNAQYRIQGLKQKHDETADHFFMRFNQLKLDTEFDDEALKHILQQNVNSDLFTGAIKQSPNVEDSLSGWETALRAYDKHRRSFDVPHNTFRQPPTTLARTDFTTRRPFNPQGQGGRPGANGNLGGRFGGNTGNVISSGASGGNGRTFGGQGQPMDVDHTRGRAPTRACFNCCSTTHLARNCPRQAVRTIADGNVGDHQTPTTMDVSNKDDARVSGDHTICAMNATMTTEEKKEEKRDPWNDLKWGTGGRTYVCPRSGITHSIGYGDEYQDF